MDLEGIMLSEKSQRKKNTICFHLLVEFKKLKKNKSRLRYREQASVTRGAGVGEGDEKGMENFFTEDCLANQCRRIFKIFNRIFKIIIFQPLS